MNLSPSLNRVTAGVWYDQAAQLEAVEKPANVG